MENGILHELPLTLAEIALARYRLSPHLSPSALEHAPGLGDQVWLKLECTQPTRSFKVRGALNAMLALDSEARSRGVITASTGNHAQGIAYAAHKIGVRARIVMPETAAKKKIAGVMRYGGEPILYGDHFDAAQEHALKLSRDENLTFVSAYNDRNVAAGQGTIGLELLDALPDLDRVIVPVGGGGMISGIAVAIRSLRPHCQIIGVNAAVSPEMYNIFYGAERPVSGNTLADALPGDIEAESITRPITKTLVDSIVLVDEDAIASAMRWLVSEHGWIGEGGGVVGIAALLTEAVPPGGKTAVVVSGGNVDVDRLAKVLSA